MCDRIGRIGCGKTLGKYHRGVCAGYQERSPQSARSALALLLRTAALELTQSALGRADLLLATTLLVRRHARRRTGAEAVQRWVVEVAHSSDPAGRGWVDVSPGPDLV